MQEIWSPNVTLEGDGYVLYQQTTKDIMKRLTQMMKGKTPEGVFSYLNDFLTVIQEPPKIKFIKSVPCLLEILKVSLLNQILKTGNLLKKTNASLDHKWNKLYLLEIVNTAKLNAIYISSKCFLDGIEGSNLSEGLYNSLLRMLKIF